MSTATDMLAQYQAAELAVLKGLSYRIGDLQLTRANLPEIIAGRREWERRVADEQRLAMQPRSGPLSTWLGNFSGTHNRGRCDW